MKKWLSMLTVILLVLTAFAACGGDTSTSTEPAPDSSAAAEQPAENSGSGIGDELKIEGSIEVKHVGISFETLSTDFAAGLRDAVIAECEARGWTYEINEANDDATRQVAQCEDMIAKGVDVLFVKPLDESSFAPISAACKEENIPLFVMNTFLNSPYTACALADQYQIGVACANILIENNPGTLHKTFLMRGPLAAESFNLRAEGQKDTLEAAGYEILYEVSTQNKQDEGIKATEDFISQGKEFDSIICMADSQAIGAAIAVQEAGLADQVYVFGNGGMPEGAKNMKMGGQLDGTIYLPPSKYISTIFEVADKALAGDPYDQKNYVDMKYMGPDNLSDFYPDL